MKQFFNFEELNTNYKLLYENIRAGKTCSIFGVESNEKVALLAGVDNCGIYIVPDQLAGFKVKELLEKIYPGQVEIFPEDNDNFVYRKAESIENKIKRTKCLFNCLNGKTKWVIASVESMLSKLTDPKNFKAASFTLKSGQQIDMSQLIKQLIVSGYRREEIVANPGDFSARGDVVDVFPITEEFPIRLNFFDDEIESIYIFDIQSQKSSKEIKSISLCPCTNIFYENSDISIISERILKAKSNKFIDSESEVEYNSIIDDLISRLELGDRGYSMDYIRPVLGYKASLLDYLKNPLIVIDEVKMVYDLGSAASKERVARFLSFVKKGHYLNKNESGYFAFDDLLNMLKERQLMCYQKLTNANRFKEPDAIVNLSAQPMIKYTHNYPEFIRDVKSWVHYGNRVFIFAGSDSEAARISRQLENHDIYIDVKKKTTLDNEESAILPYEFNSGFILNKEKIIIVGTYNILPKKNNDKKLLASRENVFNVPKIGDYVVHQVHGIGMCEGVTKLTGSFGTKDYVVVKYRDDDKLYVPIEQLSMLDRFSGAEKPTRLSKIGGSEFAKVKAKVKESVKKLAFDLLELYAERESKRGFAFEKDNMLQTEFENSFEYTETEDQLISLSEIKKDMESPKIMDRLLCGDVGFGKTEVALRAAFKAVLSGKQVCFLAPTTILSEQHYNTCKSRYFNFGVNVDVLNRFKSPKETKKTLELLKQGKIDVVCGTHRLLSKDVNFKNLGLIILDEEQKFGVEDKEKLKRKYPTVDVLTLSATPIPRTLNMSLSGIRDVSIISTPPSERLPIITYVAEFSDDLVRDAILRETKRGGQVFVLFNRVEKIYNFAQKLKLLVPEVKVSVAHGQMPANQLENVIYEFYHKESDVLVCTTLIENGIDIENANTLIVYDSDKLGLSQLYQIRGRVGRGNKTAYAYFTYDNSKILSEEAYKRLDAIVEFTEFGSGFKLAMRDLEIRGSGSLFGADQHGHLQKVGYEMYSKLLGEAVAELKGNAKEEEKEVLVRVNIDAFIPETYITQSEDRMIAYKNIASIKNEEMIEYQMRELKSKFGSVPGATQNLMNVSLIRNMAKQLGVVEVLSSDKSLELIFDEKTDIIGNSALAEALYKFVKVCHLDMSGLPKIKFDMQADNVENFKLIKEFLIVAVKNIKKD